MDTLRNSLRGRYVARMVVAVFGAMCVVLGIVCYQYYWRLQDMVKAETSGYLQEIAKQVGVNANKTLRSNFSVLQTAEIVLKGSKLVTYNDFRLVAADLKKIWNFEDIMLIDAEGRAYDSKGRTLTLGAAEYLREAVVDRKPSMAISQVVGDREHAMFAIPVDRLTVEGTPIYALVASYDMETFDQILSMPAFDGQGYAHIIRKDGAVVVRASSQHAEWAGYNLLNSLAGARIADGKSVESMKTDLAHAKSGQIEFSLDNGIHNYMAYAPLGNGEWALAGCVPVDAVNAKSELMLKITYILCSFITIVFSILIAFLTFSFYRHNRKLEEIAYVDPVTGGHTMQGFFNLLQTAIAKPTDAKYAIVYTNIEKFKVLNEQFGRLVCDDILCGVNSGIQKCLTGEEAVGRLSADNFGVLVEFRDEAAFVDRLDAWYNAVVQHIGKNGFLRPVLLEFGVYIIDNPALPFPQMIDRAKLALREPVRKFHGKLRYSFYSETISRRIYREKQLEDRMEEALANREFQVYLQPKYRTSDERIGGAEALVRWGGSSDGMIYPDEFIPLFEQNGFIIQLDLWVFEEVCRTIRGWIDAGREPVPISVNCSRVHMKNLHFFSRYREIFEKYKIPARFLEIELTETMVFEDAVNLSKIIRGIQEVGFSCSMDDFGSGYSSLNLIQDIPVDTLKLDKIFFRNMNKDIRRVESVVGSVITMARALDMNTVAEGVEERAQVDMLKRLGCDFIQGYYFACPMPIDKFEQLAFGAEDDGKAGS